MGRRVAGIALSLVGVFAVVLVAAPSARARNPLLGGTIMLGVVGMWAIYTVLAKRLTGADLLMSLPTARRSARYSCSRSRCSSRAVWWFRRYRRAAG